MQDQAQLSLDLATLFLRTRCKGVRLMKGRITIDGDWANAYRVRRAYYSRLYELKRGGFISEKNTAQGTLLHITEKGIKYLAKEKEWKKYKRDKNSKTIIVSYDIPEGKSSQRRWLREVLRLLDFTMIHKSVWVGKGPMPIELFDELRDREIFDCVHIIEVGHGGTIRKIIETN
ncbi:MAG: hypothetical protein HYS59_00820 [Candidatus Vogelbacteria bacterium]|nr:hypothetical protein [Candidatus Vogelbacteria bacterium]